MDRRTRRLWLRRGLAHLRATRTVYLRCAAARFRAYSVNESDIKTRGYTDNSINEKFAERNFAIRSLVEGGLRLREAETTAVDHARPAAGRTNGQISVAQC